MEMHGPFTSFHKESPVPGYAGLNLSRQLEFCDESIDGWNWRQIEHVLHSMDLSMEVSESFW